MTESFPGERYLDIELPNYEDEHITVLVALGVASFFWILLFPLIGTRAEQREHERKTKGKQKDFPPPPTIPITTTFYSVVGWIFSSVIILLFMSPNNYYISRRVFTAPLFTQDECNHVISIAQRAAQRNLERAQQEIGIYEKRYNFSLKEIQLSKEYEAAAAADENRLQPEEDSAATPIHYIEANATDQESLNSIIGLLEEPLGWQKYRHGNYPTTDLNVVTDPFDPADRAYIARLFDQRLAPTLSRIYGIPATSIRANDMFVVRYDAERRARLDTHTDDGDVSVNILLNDDFEGGGTRFYDRQGENAFGHVSPTRPGDFVTHSATVNHEGYHITKGTRMILVGFLSVDNVDPFTGKRTGLDWFASWGSLAWSYGRFRSAYNIRTDRLAQPVETEEEKSSTTNTPAWYETKYLRSLLYDLSLFLLHTGDAFGTHRIERLVRPEKAEAYLQSFDEAPPSKGAVWFKGQQINVDMDGKVSGEWLTRTVNQDRFEEL